MTKKSKYTRNELESIHKFIIESSPWASNVVDEDYGIDIDVEIHEDTNDDYSIPSGLIFRVQLKSIDNSSPNADDSISYSFDIAHIKYWNKCLSNGFPVVIILYDVNSEKLYYALAWEEFEDIQEGKKNKTIRFEKQNIYNKVSKINLEKEIRDFYKSKTNILQTNIVGNVRKTSLLLEHLYCYGTHKTGFTFNSNNSDGSDRARHLMGIGYDNFEFEHYNYDPYNIIGNALLTYDKIFLDIKYAPILRHLIGQEAFEEALDDDSFNFYSIKGEFETHQMTTNDYFQLSYISELYNPDHKEEWSDIASRLAYYITHSGIKFLFEQAKNSFIDKTVYNTTVLDERIDYEDIINELNLDLTNNKSIITAFDIRENTDKEYIQEYDAVKILRMVDYNKGLCVQKALNTSAINLAPGGGLYIKKKFYSPLLQKNVRVDEASKLLNITDIIPISFLINNKLLSFKELIHLRRQNSFVEFRQWLCEEINSHNSIEPKELAQKILKIEGIPKIWTPNESVISIITRDKINEDLKNIPPYHYKEDDKIFVTAQNLRFREEKSRKIEGTKYKINRNDRCPCGSGLKYKKCCLK